MQISWLKIFFAALLLNAAAGLAAAQSDTEQFRVYAADGKPATLADIAARLDAYDALIIGEKHDDAGAHEVESALLKLAFERYGAQGKRPFALSLEMFERDVQTSVDEYLAGLISERHFLLSSRPWDNYPTDYKPLVEYAHAQKFPVLASNAPARYVNMVSRLGRDSLVKLSPAAKAWLPPLPFPAASAAYGDKFNALMGGGMPTTTTPNAAASPHGAGGGSLLDAQTLRDAAMAQAVAAYLQAHRGALVVHVNGSFHSEEKLGVPEQLKTYRPNTRALVVTVVSDAGFPAFDAQRLGKLGDYIIVSNPARARSFNE